MRILVLGGTRFVGRHLVEAARAAGATATLIDGESPLDAALLPPAGRDVTADLRDRNDAPIAVAHPRDREPHLDPASVLAPPDRLALEVALAGGDSAPERAPPLAPLEDIEQRDRPPKRLRGHVPVNPLGARIPAADDALRIGRDDRVPRRFHHGGPGGRTIVGRRRRPEDAAHRRRRRPARREQADQVVPFHAGDLEIDLSRRLVLRSGEEIHLTPTEYGVLRYLAEHAGRVVTHGQLLRSVMGPGYEDAVGSLRVYVASLRKKLESNPASPRIIVTEAGIGYRLQVD